MHHKLLDVHLQSPTEKCDFGEILYLNAYKDIAQAVKEGDIKSGFDHWKKNGKLEGRSYYCNLDRITEVLAKQKQSLAYV